jgi:hypothetical protein
VEEASTASAVAEDSVVAEASMVAVEDSMVVVEDSMVVVAEGSGDSIVDGPVKENESAR